MRLVLLLVAGLALIGFVVVAVVLPQREATHAKDAARALVAGAEAAKQQVAAAAEKSGSVSGAGKGVKLASRNDPSHGEMKWLVSDDGVIRGWNEPNALEVTLTPALQAGRTSWNCRGYPIGAMPAGCGGRS